SYDVAASLNNANYEPATAGGPLVIGKATATIMFNGLTPSYNGAPKPVTVTTSPADLTVIAITYDGLTAAPTAAGSYAVVASLSNDNYKATTTGATLISESTATMTLGNLSYVYDGN